MNGQGATEVGQRGRGIPCLLRQPRLHEGAGLFVRAELLGDPSRRDEMGEAGRRRAAERFSTERMVAEMEHLYDTLMAEKR